MMFCPSIQISPTFGFINPTRCLSNTLFPPPLRPMMASVSPRVTSRSTPRRISCWPMRFTRPRTSTIESTCRFCDDVVTICATRMFRSLIARRVNDVEQHREKEIANQDCERAVHHRLSRGATHADRALARGQSLVTTNEDNQNSETERFRQAHDDVPVPRPAHHVGHVVGAVNLEQKNCDKISGGNANRDALGHQEGH